MGRQSCATLLRAFMVPACQESSGTSVLLGALIASWQLYVTFAHPSELPGLSEVVWALVEGRMGYGYLAVATWMSLVVLALGLYIGVVIAVLLVILATWTRMGDDLLNASRPNVGYRTSHSHPADACPLDGHDTHFPDPGRCLLCRLARRYRPEMRPKGIDPTIVMVEAAFGSLERHSVLRWGMKSRRA